MIDSPVLWGNRTVMEIVVPLCAGVGVTIFTKSAWPLLPALMLFLFLPRLRSRWGRQRLVHFLWGLGRERELNLLLAALRNLGGAGDERPQSLFEDEVVRRLRP